LLFPAVVFATPLVFVTPIVASPVFAPAPSFAQPPPVAATGGPAQACYAQQFICPLQQATASGSPCSCPAGPAGAIPGVAQ
jgi:hypothetical protein